MLNQSKNMLEDLLKQATDTIAKVKEMANDPLLNGIVDDAMQKIDQMKESKDPLIFCNQIKQTLEHAKHKYNGQKGL